MPSLASPEASRPFVKLMLCGPSKSGKTAALASLVEAGYNLRIADWDCKIEGSYLHTLFRSNPAALARIGYMQFRDKYDAKGEPIGNPGQGAYDTFLRALDKWEDGTKPGEWGHDTVLVIDTLNLMSYGAFNSAKLLNRNYREQRLFYKGAQNSIFAVCSKLWDSAFHANVIITSHIKEIATDRKVVDTADGKGTTEFKAVAGSPIKQFPATIGEALSREVGAFTNELYKIEVRGTGPSTRRVIITGNDGKMDLGTGVNLPSELDAKDGLLRIFKAIRGE